MTPASAQVRFWGPLSCTNEPQISHDFACFGTECLQHEGAHHCTALALTPAPSRPPGVGEGFLVRPARARDFWPLADLHCSVFFPGQPHDGWKGSLSRVDRVLALQMNLALEQRHMGRCAGTAAARGLAPGFCGSGRPRRDVQHGGNVGTCHTGRAGIQRSCSCAAKGRSSSARRSGSLARDVFA
jgi:hypothetical protein